MITLDQSIRIYARASRAWFGANAAAQARLRAEKCQTCGDLEGVEVWLQVKCVIDELDRNGVPRRSAQI